MSLLDKRIDALTDWAGLSPTTPTAHSGLSRLWRSFMTARIVVGVVLVLLQFVTFWLGQSLNATALLVSLGYLVLAVLGSRLLRPQPPLRSLGPMWLMTVGVDLATFALLQVLQSININFAPMFALPVLMAAVVGTLPVGLATTAAVSILLLVDPLSTYLTNQADAPNRLLQAGLTGTGLFIVSLLAQQFSWRLAREEQRASLSRSSARLNAQVNELVIETLGEGILVIDAEGRVHAANPAALRIFGRTTPTTLKPFALLDNPAWAAVAELASHTLYQGENQSAQVSIDQELGAPREVQIRTRATPALDKGSRGFCVMFLQDLRELEARIRTEKLAAMGRMSAAVAHEIRNPLTAITQASALLAEDLSDPGHQKLNSMIQQNALRLARVVADILEVSHTRDTHRPLADKTLLALDAAVSTFSSEWARQTKHGGLMLFLESDAQVQFDAEHLRRILVNLLDNAARYASSREGGIQILTTHGDDGRARLNVWSDGAPLDPAVERHLFEPFFSSESRSSGLGLYLCREMCERHGATIAYERQRLGDQGPDGNSFLVHFGSRSSMTNKALTQ